MTDDRKARIGLVLQGGGARGAYQVGVLKAVAEITGARRSPFQIVSGASVGAINAAPFAASASDFQRGVRNLEKLWRGLHSDSVYKTNPGAIMASGARWLWTLGFGGLGVGDPCALLDNAPLEQLLEREFDPRHVARAIRRGTLHALCITASSYEGGQAITFFQGADGIEEWSRARRRGTRIDITARHLLASAALPFVFPAVNLDGHYFGDGSLRLTAPLSPAIRMAADRLLVVGARDNLAGESGAPDSYPSIGEMAGHALDILFNDNLDADHERLCRVNETLALIPKEARAKTPLRVIDIAMLLPSRDLRVMADEHRHEMPRTIRLLLRSLGSWGKNSRLISYLLFEPGYIGALIDLGYDDTMGRADEIAAFLT